MSDTATRRGFLQRRGSSSRRERHFTFPFHTPNTPVRPSWSGDMCLPAMRAAQQFLHPAETGKHPTTGFHVASVHSMRVPSLIPRLPGELPEIAHEEKKNEYDESCYHHYEMPNSFHALPPTICGVFLANSAIRVFT